MLEIGGVGPIPGAGMFFPQEITENMALKSLKNGCLGLKKGKKPLPGGVIIMHITKIMHF